MCFRNLSIEMLYNCLYKAKDDAVIDYIEKERQINDEVDRIFRQQKDGKIDQQQQQLITADGNLTTSSEDSGVQDDGSSDNSLTEIIYSELQSTHF